MNKLAFLLCGVMIYASNAFSQEFSTPLEPNLFESKLAENNNLLINRLSEDGYGKWTPDSVDLVLLPAMWHERDSLMNVYESIPDQQSVRYYYANKAVVFLDWIAVNSDQERAWFAIVDSITKANKVAAPEVLTRSAAANDYLSAYMLHAYYAVILEARESGEETLLGAFGLAVDTLKQLVKTYGERYLPLVLAANRLPDYAHERLLMNHLVEQTKRNELSTAVAIHKRLADYFPQSVYLPACNREITRLQRTLADGQKNKHIIFIENPDSITSFQSLLQRFNGKVVYLDIWGTWCGPCVAEITQYTPDLKRRFAGRDDIVFVYLAMEHDLDKWKEFVWLNGVTGYHIYKDEARMEPFWIDLLGQQEKSRSYPTYAIFDRKGGLINASAKRPSDGEALYLQLEEVLNK